jgi:hypothetical protein
VSLRVNPCLSLFSVVTSLGFHDHAGGQHSSDARDSRPESYLPGPTALVLASGVRHTPWGRRDESPAQTPRGL